MKKINAIIRPEMLNDVKEALAAAGHFAMTVYDVKGRGAQKGICLQYRGKQIVIDLIPKMAIDMVVKDEDVHPIIDIIRKSAHTGNFGDGKIFVSPIEFVAAIRTDDESNEEII